MAWAESTLNAGADAVAGTANELRLYLGDPSAGGVELSGGSYAPQTPSFPAASQGETTDTVTFAIPVGGHFDYAGVFDGATLVNQAGLPEEQYGSAGTYDLTVDVSLVNPA